MSREAVKSKKSEGEVGKENQEAAQEAQEAPSVEADAGASESPKPLPNAQPQANPDARAKLAEIRSRIETRVGQLVLQMMQLPRYRHQTLGDLNHLIIEPLLRDRVAIAYAKGEGEQPDANPAPIGVAIWASVSESADAKIQEQVRGGSFPVRLAADDWASGDKLWLLDIVSMSQKAASAVLVNFRNIAGERPVQLHPLVARTIDPELLKQLKQK